MEDKLHHNLMHSIDSSVIQTNAHLHFFEKSPIFRSLLRSASLLHSLYSTSNASSSVSRFSDCAVAVAVATAPTCGPAFDSSEQHTINLFKRCVRALIELLADIFQQKKIIIEPFSISVFHKNTIKLCATADAVALSWIIFFFFDNQTNLHFYSRRLTNITKKIILLLTIHTQNHNQNANKQFHTQSQQEIVKKARICSAIQMVCSSLQFLLCSHVVVVVVVDVVVRCRLYAQSVDFENSVFNVFFAADANATTRSV